MALCQFLLLILSFFFLRVFWTSDINYIIYAIVTAPWWIKLLLLYSPFYCWQYFLSGIFLCTHTRFLILTVSVLLPLTYLCWICLNCVFFSFRQHVVGFCFLIKSNSFFFFIGMFNSFTFSTTISMAGCTFPVLVVVTKLSYLLLSVLFLSFGLMYFLIFHLLCIDFLSCF